MLTDDTLVATVMSNLGLRVAMAEQGITMIETRVGDRYVLEALNEHELSLGGEQSGHIIFTSHATTGDGILTGLQLAAEMARTGKTLAELALGDDGVPAGARQRARCRPPRLDSDETIAAAVADAEDATRRRRTRAAAPVGHRAARARHGRGRGRRDRRRGQRGSAAVVRERLAQ